MSALLGNIYFQLGGATVGIISIGVLGALITWYLQTGIEKAIDEKPYILPLIGGFASVGLSMLVLGKFFV